MVDYIGQQLGKYRLTRLLGTGGFAEVYLGVHIHLNTEAAVKLLHTQLATEAETEKFRQEARTIASLTHPNIVRVLDFDVQDGTPYLVMDYAPNGSLRQCLPAGKPLAPAEILPYLAQVADALQYAHDQKLVHRDIKPENMLLGRRGEVLLSDFGIATVAQSTTSQKTQGVAGTAAYMAPEQIQGKPRPSSDLYSLGVIVYEWLAGERPFQGTFTEVASQHLFAAPPPLRDRLPNLPPPVEQVVLTTLAKDPKDRFGSVRAFATAFAQASGVDASASMLSTRAVLPPAPGAPLSSQPGITVTGPSQLTPQVTPNITPQLSSASTLITPPGAPGVPAQPGIPSAPPQPNNQFGPSVLFSPTQLIPPAAMPSPLPPGSGPHPAAASTNTRNDTTLANAPGSATYLPPGWAAAPASIPSGGQATEAKPLANVAAPPAPPGAMPRGKPRRGLRVALMVLAAVVALALIGGGAAYGLPLLLGSASTATGATVTIIPRQSDLSNPFNITAVTGTPDSSQNQVGARIVSATAPGGTQAVNATGTRTTSATYASGSLLFWTNFQMQYPAGSVFTGSSGVSVVIESDVNLNNSSTYVSAHAANPGTGGNIPAGDINIGSNGVFSCPVGATLRAALAPESPQSGSTNVICNQQPFSGGRNASTAAVVRQSDINTAANALIQANQPNAQQIVQGQLQANEQLAGTPQCQPKVSADHNAGDVASQVTVTVTFTCTGEAFDRDSALSLAGQLLKNQAASNPGQGYVLVGQIEHSLISAASPDSQGSIALVVKAEGVWVYQFTDAQKQTLASLIAGKSKQDALTMLLAQTGVDRVDIQTNGGDGQKLPTSASEITIKVQDISGL